MSFPSYTESEWMICKLKKVLFAKSHHVPEYHYDMIEMQSIRLQVVLGMSLLDTKLNRCDT